ncbi:osmotin [Coleophoma cylindrospora]|uniref:Osmotin n=1 Tax=Coleophoma cylindrospora TaxID=1849047 RepID=A0A3D8S1Q5_9HELO|nr:osmotin [Coleophoma cylindrospora]
MPSTRRCKNSSLQHSLLAALFLSNICTAASVPSSHSARPFSARTVYSNRDVHWGPPTKRDNAIPLVISNNCGDTIWPALASQAGTGPGTGGFALSSGDSKSMTVSSDWQGRVWGRTNCSFNVGGTGPSNLNGNNGNGQACDTGDCNGVLSCVVTGNTPVTLWEVDLAGGSDGKQTYYDISLVDGYNLPIGVTYIPGSNTALEDIPPNLTNCACIGTPGFLTTVADSGTSGNSTNGTYPLPYEASQTDSTLSGWCPWDYQLTQPTKPGDGVYPYPDDNIQRPVFDPCLSACAKTNSAKDCCTGAYDQPSKCKPSLYSTQAKAVCPDAYSYAYDDTTSTFIIPTGGGWEVTFCPAGRSTNILKTFGTQLTQLAQTGQISKSILTDASNITLITQKSEASSGATGENSKFGGVGSRSLGALVVCVAWAVFW